MKKVIVAGASGYLGKYLLKELKSKGYESTALVRNTKKLEGITADNIIQAEVTQADSLKGVFENIDIAISTIGITRQKDGLTYMNVDYKANMNLMYEARSAGVKKFIFVSVLNGQRMKNLKMVEAKERFVDELQSSGMDYCIIRPNGFFSDMTEVLDMAKKGTVYLFGNGEYQGNPIHGEDLAKFMIDHLESNDSELDIGGPDLMTQNEIAQIAFQSTDKSPKIAHVPIWIRDLTLWLIRSFSSQKKYGPIEFFMTVMTRDMIAPRVGHHHLDDYYQSKMNGNQRGSF